MDYSDTDSETDFDDLMEAFVFRFSFRFNRYRFGCGNCGHNFRSRDSSYMSGEGSSQGKKEWETESEPVEPKSKSQKRRQKKQRQKDAQKKFQEGRQFH